MHVRIKVMTHECAYPASSRGPGGFVPLRRPPKAERLPRDTSYVGASGARCNYRNLVRLSLAANARATARSRGRSESICAFAACADDLAGVGPACDRKRRDQLRESGGEYRFGSWDDRDE